MGKLVYFSVTVPSFVKKKKTGTKEGRKEREAEGREERNRTEKNMLITPNFMGNYRLSTA